MIYLSSLNFKKMRKIYKKKTLFLQMKLNSWLKLNSLLQKLKKVKKKKMNM